MKPIEARAEQPIVVEQWKIQNGSIKLKIGTGTKFDT